MRNLFLSIAEASLFIASGASLFVAGSAEALAALPKGRWIGGSTPYFMTEAGGVLDHGKVFCTVLDEAAQTRIDVVPADDLPRLLAGRFAHGFSYVLVPAFSAVHQGFALGAPALPGLYDQPLIGWITGIDLADLGQAKPVAVNGETGTAYEDAAVVMHVSLGGERFAEADIVNLFTQGAGAEIVFPATGFAATTALVDGQEVNFAAWLRAGGVATALPLVADYNGAMVNVSFQAVHEDRVEFYAPVVAGRAYRLAAPVGDYPAAYGTYCGALDNTDAACALSFNCILNYLYAALEGKTTGGFVGPVTFGEIAYILLNQTLVRLDVKAQEMAEAAE
jgi:hypothetical protein